MTNDSGSLLPHQRKLKLIVLAFLFACAFLIRVYGISEPSTEFHPLRQYRAALIARGLYFSQVGGSVDQHRQEIARLNMEQQGSLEPSITEHLAAWSYRLAGGEHLWIPRLYSVLFWLIGGFLLFRLAEKLFFSPDQALFAAAFYLLLPFSVIASRSFQPDPLMIMLMLVSLNLIWWYHEKPSHGRLMAAALISSLAPFVKPICLFVILMSFVMLSLYRQRTWRGIVNPPVFIFALLLFLPTGIYYLSGILGGGLLRDEAQAQFIPALLSKQFFWVGWFTQVSKVVGAVVFVAAFLGLAQLHMARSAYFLSGMWIGYLVMGLSFNYTIYTHDYYQLQLIPIVALCLSILLISVIRHVAQLYHQPVMRAVLLCILIFLAAVFSVQENRWRAVYRVYYESMMDPVIARIGPEIGSKVNHSLDTVMLTGMDDGLALEYFAEISGQAWPCWLDQQAAKLQGINNPSSRERFDSILRDREPEYFIVTDMAELEYQPGLKEILDEFPVLVQAPNYVIYDLRSSP